MSYNEAWWQEVCPQLLVFCLFELELLEELDGDLEMHELRLSRAKTTPLATLRLRRGDGLWPFSTPDS